MKPIEILVQRVLSTRNAVHLVHWKETNYAAHMALGDLYDTLIEEIDTIVETYQGNFGLITPPEITNAPTDDIIKLLKSDVVWINANTVKISRGIRAIDNLIDGLVGEYLHTIYKLINLH